MVAAGFIVLLVVLTSIGAIEVHQALRRVEMSSAIVPVVVGNVLIIGGTYAAAQAELVTNVPWHVVLLGTIGGTVLLALIWRMFGGADGYARDSAAIGRALGAERVSEFTLFALASTNPELGALTASAPPAAFANNHFGYALTWFGLAIALVGFYLALARRQMTAKDPS